ncbi:Protein kinase domain-containing protein [Lentzea fradiae]|uniref:Protein kinase domain-containing protein n=1 Tax=Lentzea fradiae TaxID=200378 RepID=A0A1G7VKT3_9PSEU|nr:serine/threonine-protein kinase [Lentzea fradiae]SDG60462.1 Protein kinase domain-containing protein [Lentzea fradiae]
MPDTTLLAGRYEVGELLTASGRAEVRRGRDTVLARDVAIKFFRPGTRRVHDEIRALARLSHPGVIGVFDADPAAEVPYAVLERVEGRTLHDRVTAGSLNVADVRRLGAALADALAHVHSHGFVHCAVRPATVLLADDNAPRLADFGLAHLADSACLRLAGQIFGTAAYQAPEQSHGGEITPAVDVYALGLVLLECLTGRPQATPEVPDDLPFDLQRLLAAMTAPSASRRPTAQECVRALPALGPPTLIAPKPRRPRAQVSRARVSAMPAANRGAPWQTGRCAS